MSTVKKITEVNATNFAGFVLEAHNGGAGFRDSTDIQSAISNGIVTIDLCIDMISNFEGTVEEKLAFLKNSREEIVKFHAKK